MHLFSSIGLLAVLTAAQLLYTDFRSRKIGILWLSVFAICVATFSFSTTPPKQVLLQIGINCLLTWLLWICMAVYLHLRYATHTTKVSQYFGTGDWGVIVAVSPAFRPTDFLYFLIASSLAALIWWFILNRKKRHTIPFAGIMCILYIGIFAYNQFQLWQS